MDGKLEQAKLRAGGGHTATEETEDSDSGYSWGDRVGAGSCDEATQRWALSLL